MRQDVPKEFEVKQSKVKSYKQKDKKVMKGNILNYNAGIQAKYKKMILMLSDRMINETTREIIRLFNSDDAKEFYAEQSKFAQDASIASQARILTNKLMQKFAKIFNDRAWSFAEYMTNSTLRNSKVTLADSLKKLSGGISIDTDYMGGPMRDIIKSIVAENVSLIKSIGQDYQSRVQKAVLRSITFGEGLKDLAPQLQKFGGITQRHAKNMALDQTRKTYNAINKAKMEGVGIGKFEWVHSGGGQHPRKDHIEMSGNIYSFDDLPVIVESTGERGIPGQAINCRCRMAPVIEFEED